MFQKFRNKSDDELVFEYKKTHNEDIENEIISRYQKNARLLAGLLFSKYKFLYQVEYDDIYSILLASLFPAIKRFNDDKDTFYHYWKTVATNEVNLYVGNFSQNHNQLIDGEKNTSDEPIFTGHMRQKPEVFNDDFISTFNLDDILDNPKHNLNQQDADIFRLYLAGYSIYEIADMAKKPYNIIRYRISLVRRRIANILFNQ